MSAAIPKVSYGQPIFYIKEGDTQPSIQFCCEDENQQHVPITGATGVMFRYWREGADRASAITKVATIVAADQGQLRYDWIAADTVIPGDYRAEWVVAFPNGGQRTFPVRGHQPFNVEARLGDEERRHHRHHEEVVAPINNNIVLGDAAPVFTQLIPIVLNPSTDTAVLEYEIVPTSCDCNDTTSTVLLKTLEVLVDRVQGIWQVGELPLPGSYQGLVRITRTGDPTFPRTFPGDGTFFTWTVFPRLAPVTPPSPNFTVDAMSGVVIPQNDVEWDRFAASVGVSSGGPTSILPFQDAVSPALDTNGKNDMATVVAGAAHTFYRQPVANWSSVGIQTTNAPLDIGIVKQGGDLPSENTNSYLSMQNIEIEAPISGLDQGYMSLCNSTFGAGIRNNTHFPLINAGGALESVGSKPIPIGDARFNPWLKYDITHSVVKLYTNDEVLSFQLSAPSDAGPEVDFGIALASGIFTVTGVRPYASVFIGKVAEKSDAEIGAMMSGRKGLPVTWWDAPVVADHGKFFPCGIPQWGALDVPAPVHQYNLSETFGVAVGDTLGDILLVGVGTNQGTLQLGAIPSDLSRRGIGLTDGTESCGLGSSDTRFANPATTSIATMFVVNVASAAHGTSPFFWSWVGGIGGNAFIMIIVDTSGHFGLYVNGVLYMGTVPQFGSSIPATIVYDVTNSRLELITPAEVITATFTAITSGRGLFVGSTSPIVPTVGGVISKIVQWEGAVAEASNNIWRDRYEALGWSTAW